MESRPDLCSTCWDECTHFIFTASGHGCWLSLTGGHETWKVDNTLTKYCGFCKPLSSHWKKLFVSYTKASQFSTHFDIYTVYTQVHKYISAKHSRHWVVQSSTKASTKLLLQNYKALPTLGVFSAAFNTFTIIRGCELSPEAGMAASMLSMEMVPKSGCRFFQQAKQHSKDSTVFFFFFSWVTFPPAR